VVEAGVRPTRTDAEPARSVPEDAAAILADDEQEEER
jgi:hypothetical protein